MQSLKLKTMACLYSDGTKEYICQILSSYTKICWAKHILNKKINENLILHRNQCISK